jgi:hypothetical protein
MWVRARAVSAGTGAQGEEFEYRYIYVDQTMPKPGLSIRGLLYPHTRTQIPFFFSELTSI